MTIASLSSATDVRYLSQSKRGRQVTQEDRRCRLQVTQDTRG
jgi:hypothetical protein